MPIDPVHPPIHAVLSLEEADALHRVARSGAFCMASSSSAHVLEEDEARYPLIAAVNDLLEGVLQAACDIGTTLQTAKGRPAPESIGASHG